MKFFENYRADLVAFEHEVEELASLERASGYSAESRHYYGQIKAHFENKSYPAFLSKLQYQIEGTRHRRHALIHRRLVAIAGDSVTPSVEQLKTIQSFYVKTVEDYNRRVEKHNLRKPV